MDTRHPQVPVLDFACDEEIAELILLMNTCGIGTRMSCQDNNGGRGTVRRIWIDIHAEDLLPLLELLDRPAEAAEDPESLSSRMATEWEPPDWETFREDRAWHYTAHVSRYDGELMPPTISIRFPYTDLPAVIERLREAAAELDGRTIRRPSGESPDQGNSNGQPQAAAIYRTRQRNLALFLEFFPGDSRDLLVLGDLSMFIRIIQ